MSFFKKLGQALGITTKVEVREINKKHLDTKISIRENLTEIGFSNEEIDEVINIISEYEIKIDKQKAILGIIKESNENKEELINSTFNDIKEMQLKMVNDINKKIDEIKQTKNI